MSDDRRQLSDAAKLNPSGSGSVFGIPVRALPPLGRFGRSWGAGTKCLDT